MRKRWVPGSIEVRFHAGNPEKEIKVIEQVGEILYSYLCQLERDSIQSETIGAVPSNPRRTATHV